MYLIFDYLRMRCTFKGKQIPVPIIFKRLQCYEVSLLFTLITMYMSRLRECCHTWCVSMFVVYVLICIHVPTCYCE